jgi:hypothetical protein
MSWRKSSARKNSAKQPWIFIRSATEIYQKKTKKDIIASSCGNKPSAILICICAPPITAQD